MATIPEGPRQEGFGIGDSDAQRQMARLVHGNEAGDRRRDAHAYVQAVAAAIVHTGLGRY